MKGVGIMGKIILPDFDTLGAPDKFSGISTKELIEELTRRAKQRKKINKIAKKCKLKIDTKLKGS